jgi:hypothetical protein
VAFAPYGGRSGVFLLPQAGQKSYAMRNVTCPFYNRCLDRSVKKQVSFFCAMCRYKNLHEPIPYFEIEAALKLLAAVFYPEVYVKYQKERRKLPPNEGFSDDKKIRNTVIR